MTDDFSTPKIHTFIEFREGLPGVRILFDDEPLDVWISSTVAKALGTKLKEKGLEIERRTKASK